MERQYSSSLEASVAYNHPLFSSRSVIAGLLVTFFFLSGFIGLGFAIGGVSMDQSTSFEGMGMFSGIWFGVSALISLFIGSYFAARVSKFEDRRIGAFQGLIIASLFLGFFLYQTVQTIGGVGSVASNFLGGSARVAGQGMGKVIQNEEVRKSFSNVIENTIGDLQLRNELETVAINIGNRLLRGDEEGAIDYLSQESGISREEAQIKLSQFRIQAEEMIGDAKNIAGDALKATGWTLFLMVLLGAISSVFGGALGSRANLRRPLL